MPVLPVIFDGVRPSLPLLPLAREAKVGQLSLLADAYLTEGRIDNIASFDPIPTAVAHYRRAAQGVAAPEVQACVIAADGLMTLSTPHLHRPTPNASQGSILPRKDQ